MACSSSKSCGGDRPFVQQRFFDKVPHLVPEREPHRDHGKPLDLVALDQSQGLEGFVQRAESARHDDERARVLDQHDFADEEMIEFDEPIQVGVGLLFVGQDDIAADGFAATLFGPPVGRFHNPRTAAGHDDKSGLGQRFAHRPGQLVVVVVFGKPSRPKNGDAGAGKVERFVAAQEFQEHAHGAFQVRPAIPLAGQKPLFRVADVFQQRRRAIRFVLLDISFSAKYYRSFMVTDGLPNTSRAVPGRLASSRRASLGFDISLFFAGKIPWGSPRGVERGILCRTLRALYPMLCDPPFGSDTTSICCLPPGRWL